LARSQRLAAQFEQALTSRSTIDQALGVLMSRSGASPEQAFEALRSMSQSQHLKLHQVAQTLLDEAVRRARARHSDQDDDTT
jgi:AmiR/NasT family two-component response regulator